VTLYQDPSVRSQAVVKKAKLSPVLRRGLISHSLFHTGKEESLTPILKKAGDAYSETKQELYKVLWWLGMESLHLAGTLLSLSLKPYNYRNY
jgi:hypothetical protein